MSYYYNENDIAKTLKRAIAQGASYDEVDRLLQARNRKIASGGAETAQYKNDALTQEAEAYLKSRRTHPSVDLEPLRAAREQVAAENLRAAEKQHRLAYNTGLAQVEKDKAAQKKEVLADYKRNTLSGEEGLAASGLGRGVGAPSSGYGESSRTAAYLNYQNALRTVREAAEQKKTALENEYAKQTSESLRHYGDKRDEIIADHADNSIAQQNADREFLLEESKHDADVNQWNQEFDASFLAGLKEEEADAKQSAFKNTLETFKETGVVSNEAEARVLGLPVGTRSLEREEFEDESERAWSVFDRNDAWHSEEMAYKYTQLQSRGSSSGVSQEDFDNNYALFKAVGEVITQEMADALNLPVGTKYWQYVTGMLEAERAQQKTDFDTGTWFVSE